MAIHPAPDPDPKPRERGNIDVERESGTDSDESVCPRDDDAARTVEPEDEDRRIRPGEWRPPGSMP